MITISLKSFEFNNFWEFQVPSFKFNNFSINKIWDCSIYPQGY